MRNYLYNMEKNDIIIDYKEWVVPTSWDDITLKKFQDIQRYYDEKEGGFDVRDVIHILCDKSVDEVNALPVDFLNIILEKLSFMQENPKEKEPSNKVIIDGVTYQVNLQQKLKTGEYIAADSIIRSDKNNFAALLAILCRKEDEVYDSTFENEVLEDRIRMWEVQRVMEVMPIINFFIQCYATLQIPTLLSLEVEEGINHTRKLIETSRRNGDLSLLSTIRLKRKLKKLEKSIKSI